MVKNKCPECGCDIDDNISLCPFCDTVIKVNLHSISSESESYINGNSLKSKYKYVGTICLVVAMVIFCVGITRINNSDYNFYQEHYNDCIDGYSDSKNAQYSSGLLFIGAYSMIADEYQEMANEDMRKINSFKIQAGACFVSSLVLGIAGIIFIKKGNV